MNTTKTLNQQVNEIKNARMSAKAKAMAFVKLGLTKVEAEWLAKASMPAPTPRFTFTFGVEMETINCSPSDFLRAAREYGFDCIDHTSVYNGCHTDIRQFKLVPDGSLTGYNTAECVTPALDGNNKGFESLEKCCKALDRVGATVNRSCGLHVHIGAANLSNQAFCNVFVNYMRLETAIESFMALSRRGAHAQWCYSLRNRQQRVEGATTKEEMRQALNYDRYHRVNAEAYNRHQTIEFRQHQGTTNYTKISHWVKFLAKLVKFSTTTRLAENIDRIEDIPFLTQAEKNYFCRRRAEFEARTAR